MSDGDRQPVVVVSAADAAYACPLAVMLRSVAARLSPSRTLEAHVIDSGLGEERRARIEASVPAGRVTFSWHMTDRRRFAGLPLWGRMTLATYDKLLAPELLPSRVTRALWLDADVLARADLAELWDGPPSAAPVQAAPDPLVQRLGARFGVAAWKELGLDPRAPYFNAGVLLMDLQAWRAEDIGRRALEYARRYWQRVYFWDQEGLNATLAGRWAPLDPAWNWSPSLGAPGVEARLIHFTGNLKPWRYRGRSRWHRLYYAELDRTAWLGWRPDRVLGARMVAWYAASPMRGVLRPVERWHMAFTRRRTLRAAGISDGVQLPGLGDLSRLSEG